MSDLETQFKTAAAEAQNLAKRPNNDDLLKLYAYYKQATQGEAAGKRPGFTDPVGRAKFDAWKQLGSLAPEQAMQAYMDMIERLKKG